MVKARICSKIYGKAFKDKWLTSLAVYVAMQKLNHGNKTFYISKCKKTIILKSIANRLGINYTQFKKHLSKLQEENLIEFTNDSLRLVSLRAMIGNKKDKTVFIPTNVNSYKLIKEFLKALPIHSNLAKQSKLLKKKERYTYLRTSTSGSNKFIPKEITLEFNRLHKYFRKKTKGESLKINSELNLSVNKIGEILDLKSRNSIVKYKKLLKKLGIIDYYNQIEKLIDKKISYGFYCELKSNGIYTNTFYSKGYVYRFRPTVYTVR